MKRHIRGVSLLELIVTIGIIVALAGIIMPAFNIIKDKGRAAEAKAEIVQVDSALLVFFTDNGNYPRPYLQQMVAGLRDGYFNFDSKRMEGDTYKDPWGEPYLYVSPGVVSSKGYDLYSVGLLASTGDTVTLGRIMAAVSSSSIPTGEEKNTLLGQPAGLDQDIIWGLSEPEYHLLIKAALSLLRSTDAGYELAAKINISNLPINWDVDNLLPAGVLAAYYPGTHEILVNLSLFDGPAEVIAAVLAHEATHLADHLASGDMDFDSIEEEYDAFYNAAMVWEQLKGDKTDALQDVVLSVMRQGEDAAKDWIRARYPNIPEEDQWGDSYVVPKES